MKNRILQSAALLLLVCAYSPTDASAPLPHLSGPPPGYYDVIVTNILFNPLGWTRPIPGPAYELIATVIKENGKNKVLLRHTGDRTLHYVEIGEKLGTGVSVEKVESRSVTLSENGESTVYRLRW